MPNTAMQLLAQAGVEVGPRLGSRCWAGRWQGRPVAARVHEGTWPPSRERAALLGLADPALPRVCAVVLLGGGTVVVSALVESAPWTGPVARAAPYARALARLHDEGLVLGAVQAADLRVDGRGRPLLTGQRCPGLAQPGRDADSVALARVLAALPGCPPALRLVLGSGPPDPAALLAVLDDADLPSHRRAARAPLAARLRPAASSRLLAPAAIVALVAAVVAVTGRGHAAHPAPPPATAAAVAGPDVRTPGGWVGVVAAVDAARAAAFAGTAPLARADVPGSPAYVLDTARLQRLRSAGEHPAGLVDEVRSVHVLARDGPNVRLVVTDGLGGYRLVSAAGSAAVAPAAARAWSLTLREFGSGWRLVSARPVRG